MDASASLPVIFSAIGAAAGLLLQQAIDVWKTRTGHRQELQRRFFDLKLQTAIDLARSLDALVAAHHARLAEAAERTRDDENFRGLEMSREVVSIQRAALEKDYDRYVAAFAVLELVFSQDVVTAATEGGVAVELTNAWRQFDDGWSELEETLGKLMTDSRMEELRQQRARGQYEEGAHDEMVHWMAVYKSSNAKLRAYLPNLAALTLRAEEHRRNVLFAIRQEMKPYHV